MNKETMSIYGIPGTITRIPGKEGMWKKQKWVSDRRTKTVDGEKVLMHVEIRYDDELGSGHNTFSITGYGWYGRYKSRDSDFGGCCHDRIEQVFPELKHLIKWHLTNSDGPMHYPGNVTYLAGNRDCRGLEKGEPSRFEKVVYFGDFPVGFHLPAGFTNWLEAVLEDRDNFSIVKIPHEGFAPKYTFDTFTDKWAYCPFDTLQEAEELREALKLGARFEKTPVAWSEGKERDLDAARRAACWPEATDEQLCLPRTELEDLLMERLPGLLEDFRRDVEAAGFLWTCEEEVAV